MEFLKNANAEQLSAIQHEGGPLLIVAGAGTGKTKVITSRIAWLILGKKVPAEQILALTFSEKAAREMTERTEDLLPLGFVDLWISTFHSFGDKILRRHGQEIGLPGDYHLLNKTESWLLIRKNIERFNFRYYRQAGNPGKFIHDLLAHFLRCKDELISPEAYLEYAEELRLNADSADFLKKLDLPIDFANVEPDTLREIGKQERERVTEVARAYAEYDKLLRESNCLDFSDLLGCVINLFEQRPAILEKYRTQFAQVLVDEFQDTNLAQYKLIRLLAEPKKNLTVVGDDDQSIYKFRGASIANIMNFKADYPGAKEIVLRKNYRSAQIILDLAHRFIEQNNPNRLEVKLKIDKTLTAEIVPGGEVAHLHAATARGEIDMVIEKIRALAKADKDASWSDFAILARSNDSAESFAKALEQAGIPNQFLSLKGLYNQPVILDLLNYAKLLDNYHESAAVFRIMRLPCFGLLPATTVEVGQYAKSHGLSLYEALQKAALIKKINPEEIAKITALLTRIEKDLVFSRERSPSRIFLRFLNETGYLTALTRGGEAVSAAAFRQLEQFFNKVQEFENQPNAGGLKEFLEMIDWEIQSGDLGELPFDPEAGPEFVKIMTVHTAKGLEFKNVFLVNLVDRRFPSDERREAIPIPLALIKQELPSGDFHLEEERRLFYVGITRAKERLFFTSADNYGGARQKKLSRFLLELGYNKPEITIKDSQQNWFQEIADQALPLPAIPKKFSFSQMRAYDRCPLSYKFASVYRIPTAPNAHLIFGDTIHRTLWQFVSEYYASQQGPTQGGLFGEERKREPQLIDLLTIYENAWNDVGYANETEKKEFHEKGKKILTDFYERFQSEKPQVKLLEHAVNIKIDDALFNCRLDRVDEADKESVVLVDYKTGKPKGEKLNTDDKQQLVFYQLVAEEVLGLKVAALRYYYLEDAANPYREFKASDKDKQKLKEKFSATVARIKAREFPAKPAEEICRRCDFRHICEYKKV